LSMLVDSTVNTTSRRKKAAKRRVSKIHDAKEQKVEATILHVTSSRKCCKMLPKPHVKSAKRPVRLPVLHGKKHIKPPNLGRCQRVDPATRCDAPRGTGPPLTVGSRVLLLPKSSSIRSIAVFLAS